MGGELSSIDDSMWEEIMKEVDANKDGVINFEEFCQVMAKFAENSTSLSQDPFWYLTNKNKYILVLIYLVIILEEVSGTIYL